MGHGSIGESVHSHVRFLIRSFRRSQSVDELCIESWELIENNDRQGKTEDIVEARPAVFAVVQDGQPKVMLRYISPLVTTNLKDKKK